MTLDEIIKMARQAGFDWSGKDLTFECFICTEELEAFAKLVAEKEREVVANWIMDRGFATGHGDSIVDLLDQLEWQIAEKERERLTDAAMKAAEKAVDVAVALEREACAKVCEEYDNGRHANAADLCAEAIRARGQA